MLQRCNHSRDADMVQPTDYGGLQFGVVFETGAIPPVAHGDL